MPALQRTDDVFVLDLGDDENRFSRDWMASVTDALDEVDAADGPRALLTVATGKFWSNGLDLDWLTSHLDEAGAYVDQVQGLLARYLETSVPTVAVLQGHTFAAGALLALAHDVRLMRADRGFFCLPEVDISIPFSPGMSALIQSKLTPDTAQEAMLTGRRYGGARRPGRRDRVRRPAGGGPPPRCHRVGEDPVGQGRGDAAHDPHDHVPSRDRPAGPGSRPRAPHLTGPGAASRRSCSGSTRSRGWTGDRRGSGRLPGPGRAPEGTGGRTDGTVRRAAPAPRPGPPPSPRRSWAPARSTLPAVPTAPGVLHYRVPR